ncbi:MAG: imidazoleglycerol-phosphate dehydratase [Planctomycetes bacterium B3_Pla]|nr:MAG: imidazoleglycerol-phosphate dehydratase [Planctomycetes bacterium B3_Pla]
MKQRTAGVSRETKETKIELKVALDGPPECRVATTLPFLDHLLEAFGTHGRFGLEIEASGDTHVDPHHLIEDCGIVLGSALARALGDFSGIQRAGCFAFPMDESLAEVALDLCGRPNLVWKVELGKEPVGTFDPNLARDFMKGLADSLRATVHVTLRYSGVERNDHHALEAIFKALGRALRQAVTRIGTEDILSTKGQIDGRKT